MSKDKSGNWFKRHKILSVIGVIIVIAIIASAAGGGSKKNSTTASKSSTGSTASKTAAMPKLNQVADDGKFAFTVTSFSCGQSELTQAGDAYATAQAQGQFCTMGLSIKNIGSVAQDFFATNQYVYDSTNKQYSYSSDGTIIANPAGSEFSGAETVNPGVTVSGTLVFDVPTTITPVTAMLHDSAASNGVKVSLQ